MKILMLTPYLPYPLHSGGQIRTYNLLTKLAAKHEITLFALIKDPTEKQWLPNLQKYCRSVRLFRRSGKPFTLRNIIKTGVSSYPFLVVRNHVPAVTQAIKDELSANQYDLIHAETFYMMPHLPTTPVPTLLVEQTIEYLGYESYAQKAPRWLRPILRVDIAKLKKWEHYFWNHCSQLVVMSADDQQFIRQQVSPHISVDVVENGVDTDWFKQVERSEPVNPTVLFVGTFRWLPNVEAVRYLVSQVWPLVLGKMPQARLRIVGAAPTTEVLSYASEKKHITVSGNIPDIRTAFATSHVLAAPVWSGKGTRYKVLEGMAAGTPVVATSTAVEGLGIEPGAHALIADTADQFAEDIIQLLQNEPLRSALRRAGRLYIRRRFDWSLIAKKLDVIYQRMGKSPL